MSSRSGESRENGGVTGTSASVAGETTGEDRARATELAVVLVPLVLVPALGATQGGFLPDSWVWAGALAAWATGLAVVVSPAPGALRRWWPWLAASGALLLWTLLSVVWSTQPSQSLLEARRMLVYALVVLALARLVGRGSGEALVAATCLAVSALVVYALFRYLFEPRRAIEFEGLLLNKPLGYANALGILAAIGILLAAGIASRAESSARRAAAAGAVPLLALALQLTGSDASWLALAVGIALVALLDPSALRLTATLAFVGPPAAILVWLGHFSRLADISAPTPRLSGTIVAAVAVVCAAAAALAGARFRPRATASGPRARRLVLLAFVLVALVGAAVVGRAGSTQPRASYWHVAWHDEYLAHPVLGSGAGTFGFYWVRHGRPLEYGGALDAHSLYLETLAELGPIGLLLLVALLLVPLRGVIARRSAPYVPVAVAAYAAFLVHAGLDWDWEMPAVVVAGLCCGAAAAASNLGLQRPLGLPARAAVLVAALVLGACAIAGARSHAVPGAAATTQAAAETKKAPLRRGLPGTDVIVRRYFPWPLPVSPPLWR
jgi:O-antigen ligase